MISKNTIGDQVRSLFKSASKAEIISPFIKVDALASILEVIPPDIELTCITRWRPIEVASRVSDPDIIKVLENRGNFTLLLADRLHAKIYIADKKCLAGSANVTLAGFGESFATDNIEVLVETTVDDPSIMASIEEIRSEAIEATHEIASNVQIQADALTSQGIRAENRENYVWHPISRKPEKAYYFYSSPPAGFISTADRLVISDIAKSNLKPGLSETGFRDAIRSLLSAIPISNSLLESNEDKMLTRADADSFLEELSTDDYSASDVWVAFVQWMSYFFSDKVITQDVSEVALRRAQVLRNS